jgi:phage-related protein
LSYLLERDIDSINAWLLSDGSYQRFEDTMDQKHFMMARALIGVEKRAAMGLLNPFILEFDAKPQRFLKSGEKAVDVTESKSITNPTKFPSIPEIYVSGSGDITITINGVSLNIVGLNGALFYDAETDIASKGITNLNHMVGTTGTITIPSGSNQIKVSGNVTSLKIVPRWWEL